MATNSEKIDELVHLVSRLTGRVDRIEGESEWTAEWVEKLRAADGDARVRLTTAERDIADLKARRDEWGCRAWSLVVPVFAAVVGGVIGYLLKR